MIVVPTGFLSKTCLNTTLRASKSMNGSVITTSPVTVTNHKIATCKSMLIDSSRNSMKSANKCSARPTSSVIWPASTRLNRSECESSNLTYFFNWEKWGQTTISPYLRWLFRSPCFAGRNLALQHRFRFCQKAFITQSKSSICVCADFLNHIWGKTGIKQSSVSCISRLNVFTRPKICRMKNQPVWTFNPGIEPAKNGGLSLISQQHELMTIQFYVHLITQ